MNPAHRPKFPLTWFLLVVALAGLYARSYWHADVVAVLINDGKVQAIASSRGQFVVALTDVSLGAARKWTWDYSATVPAAAETFWYTKVVAGGTMNNIIGGGVFGAMTENVPQRSSADRLGFLLGTVEIASPYDASTRVAFAAVPQWISFPLVFPLLMRLHRWRRFYIRGKRGLCPYCGYDIRGIADRCPECGAEVVGKLGTEAKHAH